MSRDKYLAAIDKAAARYGLPPELLDALVEAESNYDPNARSRVGALGLTQLMPGTAKDLGVNPLDPMQAIDGGARYLQQLLRRYKGDEEKALAAYNWGMGNVDRRGLGAAPRETTDYVSKVLELAGPPGAGWQPDAYAGARPPADPNFMLARTNMAAPQPQAAPPSGVEKFIGGLPATPWTAPLLMALAIKNRARQR